MNPDIHRLLDQAFAGVEMTPEAQDLKEEIRANLVARVDELEGSGVSPTDAARTAIAELGDVNDLLDDSAGSPGADAGPATAQNAYALVTANRVRPKPAFVVRTVVLSLVAAASIAVYVLGVSGIVRVGVPGLVGLGVAAAAALGFVTADALSQETTSNHPLPVSRALGFGLATGGTIFALGLGGTLFVEPTAIWAGVVAAILFFASIALFAWLGSTQTNRHKAWTREVARTMPPNRFETDPNAAARFGIYTVVIFIVTLAVMAVLFFVATWFWAIIALLAGLATMMLVLARMLFGHKD